MSNSITLTEGLVKLKLYDKKIDKLRSKLSSVDPVIDYVIGTNTRGEYSGLTKDELKVNAQSKLDKLFKLIENRRKLKALIAQANATTTVTICGQEYTIVQAIERKNNLLLEKEILDRLSSEVTAIHNKVYQINTKAQDKANQIVESQVQSEAKNKKTEEIEALYNLIYNKNKAEILDPYHVKELVESLQENLEQFEQEVDTKLSIINAQTMIEFELDNI